MIGPDVAAVIVEPVQGVAGAFDLSQEFLATLRAPDCSHGAVLIADEVQTGIGRCGEFFAVQTQGIAPDILTSAKALGGGMPCGAVLCTKHIAGAFRPGDSRHDVRRRAGGCGAIVAVIDAIETEKLLATCANAKHRFASSASSAPYSASRARACCSVSSATGRPSRCATHCSNTTF